MSYKAPLILIAAAANFCCGNMQASVMQGTILGIFSNPVLTGSVADDPASGQSTYEDNTGTAVVGINNSTNPTLFGTPPEQAYGSVLVWGANPGNSELDFFGAQIPANYASPFQLGTLTFTNGTSALNSLIFGATLSFYDNTVSPSTFLGSDQIVITTTSNVAGSPPLDDDYLNICGNNSDICATSIEAVESTEGGTGVTVNFTGTIVGDPTLKVLSVALAGGQTAGTNGFIGNDPPIGGTTPEPGTAPMLAGALLMGLGLKLSGARRLNIAEPHTRSHTHIALPRFLSGLL